MKQILKDTIKVWTAIILTLASVCTVIEVPILFLIYTGIGKLQVIVCILWIAFWLSLAITVSIKIVEKGNK